LQVLHTAAGELKVIETNVRASRSMPFSSKVLDIDFTNLATRAMINANPPSAVEVCLQRECVLKDYVCDDILSAEDTAVFLSLSVYREHACPFLSVFRTQER